MDYDEDGSETGSAVSDEEFEFDGGAGPHQHDVFPHRCYAIITDSLG